MWDCGDAPDEEALRNPRLATWELLFPSPRANVASYLFELFVKIGSPVSARRRASGRDFYSVAWQRA